MTVRELESAALDAHRRGQRWSEFWARHGEVITRAASGDQAEAARHAAMEENEGGYLVLVDGSIPMGNPGFSTIAGISNHDMLMETVAGAAAVVSIGTCAAFGGIPGANPNPTGAVSVQDLVKIAAAGPRTVVVVDGQVTKIDL